MSNPPDVSLVRPALDVDTEVDVLSIEFLRLTFSKNVAIVVRNPLDELTLELIPLAF